MAAFVLVHGAWSGSHGWHKLAPLLRAAGHAVTAPCLTGLGERVHLSSPNVNLSTHVTDVVNHVEFEDLRDIVLVGHSYGGMAVTGAVDKIADRVRHLVYLDAFVPADGQSLYMLTGASNAATQGEWLVPPVSRDGPNKAEEAWLNERRRAHPRACFSEPVRLGMPLESQRFGLTYIKATGDEREVFWKTADRIRSNPRWRYREIASGHRPPNDMPAELLGLLLEAAA